MKKTLCAVLSAILLLTSAACAGNNGSTGKTENTNVPKANKEELVLPDYDVKDKKVTYIVASDFTAADSNSIWADVRNKAKEKYDIDFQPILSTSAESPTLTMSLIAAGNPPSFVETHKTAAWFPRMSAEGVFSDVKKLINLEDKLWADMKDYIEYYSIGDASYACVTNVYAPETMYYNVKLIKNSGMEDPISVYKKGNWTWNKMLEYIDKICGDKDGDGTIDVYGIDLSYLGQGYMCSLGQGYTTVKDGKVSLSPLTDGNYEKFGTFASNLMSRAAKGYFKPVENAAQGAKMLFSFGGYWGVKNNTTLSAQMKAGELALIPIPKHDDTDKYYMYGITSGYAISTAGNPVGAAAVLSCYRYLNYPNEENLNRFKQAYLDEGWNEDSAHILTYDINAQPGAYREIVLVSQGTDFASSEIKSTFSCLNTDVLEKYQTWSSVRDKYLSRLQSAADSANKIKS